VGGLRGAVRRGDRQQPVAGKQGGRLDDDLREIPRRGHERRDHPLRAVYAFAERIRESGFVFMDTPGHDPVSVTGLVAGGCNLVVFSTGRGSCLGFKPTPVLKVATNTPMYENLIEDMDIDAGAIMKGAPLADVASEIFETLVAMASGEMSKSEAQGLGDETFAPWTLGPVL
jgi:altronate hydrolase